MNTGQPHRQPEAVPESGAESFFAKSAHQPKGTSDTVIAGRRMAATIADELLAAPAARIGRGVFGRYLAVATHVEDDPTIPRILEQARDLAANADRPEWSLAARRASDHVVVLAHGAEWSLVASTAGPVLILPDWASHVLRIDHDPDWQPELRALVAALAQATSTLPSQNDHHNES